MADASTDGIASVVTAAPRLEWHHEHCTETGRRQA